MPLLPGTRIGPYEIIAPIGAGGMGEVYRARDPRLQRDVALKVLPAGVANDPDRRARFEREAQAVAALSHPNILSIFDFGVADGAAYAVTEVLDGVTLRERLSAPLPIRKAVEVATQVARGLAAAHDKGIVHRDLKPENVFLLGDGQVKILDFGLAKATSNERAEESATVAGTDPGTVLGTAGYMAPEQVRGQAVDARTDLFALGVVLYEMVAGRRAFQRNTPAETMTAILNEDPPELTLSRGDVPPALDSVIRHCLERNPAERFQSARDLIFNLHTVTSGSGSGAVAASTAKLRKKLGAREAIAWGLVAALVVAAAVLAFRMTRSADVTPAVVRFHVAAPEKTSWAAPLGAPEGTNSGTISPDGRTLAFVALDGEGKSLLWVRPIDSFAARALAGTEGAAFPFWSPDSRLLGFFTQTRLKRISVDGGPAQTIAELASTPRGGSWGEGGTILFATAGSPVLRVSADGGQPTALTKPDATSPAHQWPSFLPDGRRFLYYASGARAVYLASLDSATSTQLFKSDTNAIFAASGDILFMREGALFAQRFDLTRSELVGEPVLAVERVSWTISPWNLGAFSVSGNGVLTYRGSGGARSQFAWYDRSGRSSGPIGPPGEYLSPSLSPDETKVVFTRRDDQSAGDIWAMDLGRQTMSRFTFDPASEIYPVWSPDGKTIAYESTQDGLFVRNADGTSAAQLIFRTQSSVIPTQLLLNPPRVLYFGDFGSATGFDVYLLGLEAGATPVPIVQTPITDVEPQFSPDGRWLAYASTETGSYDVFVQPHPATGARWQISAGGGRQPTWRADGREMFFVTSDRKFYAVDVQAGATFEHGAPQFLFNIPSNTISVRNSFVPSRDGKRFLVNVLLDSDLARINVDLDWARNLKR